MELKRIEKEDKKKKERKKKDPTRRCQLDTEADLPDKYFRHGLLQSNRIYR